MRTMVPEIRIDQLTGLRAILAPGRAERPDAFAPAPSASRPDARETCPFDEGRADRTPPEAWADPLRASTRAADADLFRSVPADGAHEVIVHTPRHETSLASLDEGTFATAVAGWRERMRAQAADASYVHLIVNEGPDAGASLEHTHAQLYALSFVPAEVARERERTTAYHQRTMGGHLLADVAVEEV